MLRPENDPGKSVWIPQLLRSIFIRLARPRKADFGTIFSGLSFSMRIFRLGMETNEDVGIVFSLLALRSNSTRFSKPLKA